MGLLSGIDPAESFKQEVKSGIHAPKLIELAARVTAWSGKKKLNLRALALHFAVGPGNVLSSSYFVCLFACLCLCLHVSRCCTNI